MKDVELRTSSVLSTSCGSMTTQSLLQKAGCRLQCTLYAVLRQETLGLLVQRVNKGTTKY